MPYSLGFAVGIGLTLGGIVYMVISSLSKWINLHKLVQRLGVQGKRAPDKHQILLGAGGLGGFIVGILLTHGTPYVSFAGMLTAGLGAGCIETIRRLNKRKILILKKQECGLLFESIELFMKAGTPMRKALTDCLPLANILRPAINKALAYWPAGSNKALEVLRKEIDLPEGDILVSLLKQLNQSGVEHFDGILQRESQRLEQLRHASEQISIAKKPIILTIYRALPYLVVVGTFVGALFIRALENMPFLKGGL